MNSKIFREYDIRGTVGKNLTETDAYYIGKAFGTKIIRNGGNSVCVGYDGRHSSPAFETELVKGLCHFCAHGFRRDPATLNT